jgi:dTDP-4-amino-4,6-dideoxygalactose transaminase
MMMIPFNIPACVGTELGFIEDAVRHCNLSGDGPYTQRCTEIIEDFTKSSKALLTTSCTHALEIAALLADIKVGDEVIMPSYTFVSTANPFVLRGAYIKFVDVDPLTMNIDVNQIEKAITPRTRVIVPIHYAGVASDMDKIIDLACVYNLVVITDAAQGVMARYKGAALGSLGDIGAFSFHETKNLHCGEGGAILVNNKNYLERAEVIREKGTNRKSFLLGQVDKYSWVDVGSSYLPSELNCAFLYGQLLERASILKKRLELWKFYDEQFKDLADQGRIEVPFIPSYATHNGHMFYIKVRDLQERTCLIAYAKARGVSLVFHYVPLHSSLAGKNFGTFVGEDKFTTRDSERLVRLPLYYSLSTPEQAKVVDVIYSYFKQHLRLNQAAWKRKFVSTSTKTLLYCYIVSSFNQNLLNA